MKQSTFSAVMANSIKNLLQGYTKGIRFVAVLTVLLTMGIGQAWGAEGDVLKTYDTNSSTFASGYSRKTGDNFVWWGQKGYYGANNATNHGNLKPTAADLPVVKAQSSSATTSTTGLYYLYTSEAVANVGKVEVKFTAKSGSSTVNAYVVSSSTKAASGSATWTKVTLASNSSKAQGANVASVGTYTFTFDATETDAKYYGVVFVTSSYWRATNLTFKLYEGAPSTPAAPCTVTFDACSGTCDTEYLTESSAGEGITLPEAEIDCGDVNWTFAGWAEASVTSETTDEPTLYKAGETYKPADDITLYAVYQRTEGDGESSEDVTFTFSEIASANSWTNGTAYTTVTISPITITANGGGNNGKYYTSNTSWRMYNGGSVNITTSVGEITAVSSNPSKDFTITDGSASLSFSATTEFKSITVTYSSSNSTTYYHSTPECTTETVVTLHPNGGTISEDGWELEDGLYKQTTTESNIILPTITKGNWTFAGWDKDADGEKDYGGEASIELNGTAVILSALWECTPLPAPTGLKAEPTNDGGIISWNQVTNATGYEISTDGGNTWGLSINGGSTTSHTLKNRECETTIEWQVRAVGNMGNGYCEENPAASHSFTTLECGCPSYAFHYGTNEQDNWNEICFEAVGDYDEMQIANFEIPSTTHYYVGKPGYNDNYGNRGQVDGPNSQTTTWDDMYLAMSLQSDNANGSPKLGQATGAVGTIRIFANSTWNNKQVAFIPNGYGVTFVEQAISYAFHKTTIDNKWETDALKLPDVTNNKYTVGLATQTEGEYVASNNSNAAELINKMGVTEVVAGKKMIYFKPGSWNTDGAKFAIWDATNSIWGDGTTKLLTDSDGDGVYGGYVASSCKKINLVRLNSTTTTSNIDWNLKWNQTGDITLSTDGLAQEYTITGWGENDYVVANATPKTGQNGKFRMWDNSTNKNWFVHFIPYYLLSYDANGGEGEMPATEYNTEDANNKVTVSANGFTRIGYDFVSWNTKSDGTGTSYAANATYTLSADATLYAQWQTQAYDITYKDQGNADFSGTHGANHPTTHTYGQMTTLVSPTKPNYTFGGWYDNPDCTGTSINQLSATDYTSDITLYAKWIAKPIPTLVWELNGADVTEHIVTIASESNVFPTLETTPVDLAGVKYSSSNTDVATIDANGNIILKSADETTIRAYYEEDDTYAAAEDTYTLIVKESTNCRWEEVTIDDIEYGDEVVVVMAHGLDLYALPYDKETATNSNPLAIKITLDDFKSTINNTCIWYITKEDEGSSFTLSPKTATDKYLTCNSSSNAVRINTASERNFTIENGFLKNIYYSTFLAISTNAAQKDWRHYASTNTTISSRAQTLKFYKRVCLPEGQYWVKWMVNGQEYTEDNPTTMVVAGGQVVTLPTIPDDYQLPGCTSKKFIGWTTDEILVETDDAPTMFTDAASSPPINTNQTFHALFADVEEGEEGWAQVTTTDDLIAGDIYTIGSSSTVGNGKVLGAQQSNNRAAVSWNSGNLVELTLGGSTSAWTLSDGTGYLCAASSSSNHLKTQEMNDANGTWSINFSTTTPKGSAIIIAQGNYTRNVLRYNVNSGNGGNPLFSCYKDSEQMAAIYLFKKLPGTIFSGYVTQCCTPWEAPTLSATTSIAVGGTTNITYTGTTHGDVTYTSSDEFIAGVDNTGQVTGRKPGQATITAAWEGEGEYCPAEVTIDITVTGSFTITYDANNPSATGSTASTTIAYPTGEGTVAANGFALNGHEFVKWNTKADGSGTSYNASDAITLTDNITLYAIWQPNQYDITVNVVGGSVKLGSTTITNQQTIADVVAHGQSFSFTNPTPDVEYSSTYTVTLNSGTAEVTSNSLTISNVQSDLNITITFNAKPVYTITYVVPAGDGRSVAPTSIYEGGSVTMPNLDGNISNNYDCEKFIGWTTEAGYQSGNYENMNGQKPDPFYAIGDELTNITQATTLYAVYSRAGNGPSGTIELTSEDIKLWKQDNLISGGNIPYGNERHLTKDGLTWTTNGFQQGSDWNWVQIKDDDAIYIQLPEVGGDFTTITLTHTTYSSDRKINFDNPLATAVASQTTSAHANQTIMTIPAGYQTGYLRADATYRISAISATYGSPNIISTFLRCTNDIDEVTINYDVNTSYLPAGSVVNNTCSSETFKFSELTNGQYTICNSLTPPAFYQHIGWNSQANGNGSISYEPGQVITMVDYTPITLYAQWAPEVLMSDGGDTETIWATTMGGSVTLPVGGKLCEDDPDKYDFIGWTTDDALLWNQGVLSPTILPKNPDGTTTFTPTEPTTVYAVYGQERTANSQAFYLTYTSNSQTYYAKWHNSYVFGCTTESEEAIVLYKEQIAKEFPNRFYIYYIQDGQKQYVSWTDDRLYIPSTQSEEHGWIITEHTTGYYSLQSVNASKYGKVRYMDTKDDNSAIDVAASPYESFQMISAPEYIYYDNTTCSDQIRITFVTGGATLKDSNTDQEMLESYIETTANTTITLPYCEYDGWTFLGWVEENIDPTEIVEDISRIYSGEYQVGTNNITLYAYYEQEPPIDEFDGTSEGEWKIYSHVVTNGEDIYNYAIIPNAEKGELSTSNLCALGTTWHFIKVADGQYYIQDVNSGLYLNVPEIVVDKNDFAFTEQPSIWNIKKETRYDANNQWWVSNIRTPERVLLFNNGKITNSATTNITNNNGYYLVTIGSCFNPIYTTDPILGQNVSFNGVVYITSTKDQKVKSLNKLTLIAKNQELQSTLQVSAPNIIFYNESGVEVTEIPIQSSYEQINLYVAYSPNESNILENITIQVTSKQKVYNIKNRIRARSLPENFVIAAKVGNLWYALPSQGLNSVTPPAAYPIEVDNQDDPTAVTAVPENADWSLRQVYKSSRTLDRYTTNGHNLVFVNNESPEKALNPSSSENYLLTNAQYDNYHNTTNPGLYEWTPTTTDLETYTLTNAGRTDKKLNVSVNTVFGVHAQNVATNNLRFLPINDRYTPLALQVVEWKENSIVVMYNGDPAETASVSVNGGEAQTTTLSAAQRDIAVYELTATGLAANPTQRLSITIGTEKLLLPIPYIVNSNTTDAILTSNNKTLAAVSDLVVLDGKTLTADAATASKYTFRNVTIYGGGSLIIPSGKGLGVNSLTMRVGAVVDNNYQSLYPSMLLAGTINTGNINIDYLTTADYYYPLSVPEEVTIGDIKYPVDIYGSNVDKDNTGSFQLKYYDGAQRVDQGSQYGTGWVVVDETTTRTLTPNQGYAIWGIPKKVSVNGGAKERQKYGIHRIPISTTADKLATNEKTKAEVEITAHGINDANVLPNDKGWNYLGNPYLAQLGGMDGDDEKLQMGRLIQEMIDGKWTGGWVYNNEQVRYITVTNDCQNFEAKRVADATIPAFGTFFIQAAANGAILLTAPANPEHSSIAARQYAAQQEAAKEITTGILLTGNDQTDRTGLLIADNFTEEYEFNADLSKFENSGINLYTIGKTGNLAYMAINQTLAEQPIPVGYTAPAEGLYTIAFDEDRYNATDISALYLIDYDSNEKTNLLHTDYSFVTAAGTNNQRFALQVAFAPENATNIEWVGDATVQVGVEGNTLMLNNLPNDAAVHVFDALGRLMYHAPTVPTEMQLTLPTGYYLVRIADKQHAVVIKTVIP